ncbi:MAG: TonB family protein [Pyrinomonadaceae bacterium]|nr:TonB family protein [Pyrinomonadaceae bacterium]
MKNLLGVAILAFALSLCNLGDRLKDLGKAQNGNQSTNQNSNQSNANTSAETEEPPVDSNTAAPAGTVSGGMLNDKAVSLPRPAYPPAAKAAGASGTVIVQVIVDETGKVTSATAVSGHPLLRQAAVQAAYQARFKPTMLSGKPVKVSGTISYNFIRD